MRVQGFVSQEKRHKETIERGRGRGQGRAREGTVSVLSSWGERVVLCGWQSREPELACLACFLNQGNQTSPAHINKRHGTTTCILLCFGCFGVLAYCYAFPPAPQTFTRSMPCTHVEQLHVILRTFCC